MPEKTFRYIFCGNTLPNTIILRNGNKNIYSSLVLDFSSAIFLLARGKIVREIQNSTRL